MEDRFSKEVIMSHIFKHISTFGYKRHEMSEQQIGNLRAKLATAIYHLAEGPITQTKINATDAGIEFDRTSRTVYERLFTEKSASVTKSKVHEVVSKLMKGDEEYLKAKKEAEELKDEYFSMCKVFDAAKEVLNAMALRKNA